MKKFFFILWNVILIFLTLCVLLSVCVKVLDWIATKRMNEHAANWGCVFSVYNVLGTVRDEAYSDVWKKGAGHEEGVSAATRLGCCIAHSVDRRDSVFDYTDLHAVFQRDGSGWIILDSSGNPLEVMWCDDKESGRLSDNVKAVRFGNLYVWSRGRNGKNEYGFGDDVWIRISDPYDFE